MTKSLLKVAESYIASSLSAEEVLSKIIEIALIEDAYLIEYDEELVSSKFLKHDNNNESIVYYPKQLVEWLESVEMARYKESVRFQIVLQWVDLIAITIISRAGSIKTAGVIAYGACKRAARWYNQKNISNRFRSYFLSTAIRTTFPLGTLEAIAALELLLPINITSHKQTEESLLDAIKRQRKLLLSASVGLWSTNLAARLARFSLLLSDKSRALEIRRILDISYVRNCNKEKIDHRIPLWQARAKSLSVHGPENRFYQKWHQHPKIAEKYTVNTNAKTKHTMAPHDFSTFSASFEDQRLFSERSSFFLDNEEQYDDNNKGLGEKSAILLPIDSAHTRLSQYHSELQHNLLS